MHKPRRVRSSTPAPRAHPLSAADFIPPHPTLARLRASAERCRGCELYKVGTQTVFGEGPRRARLMLVGEQPGDAEDRAGKPFVGPSGLLLDRALEASGIERDDVYVTNAVKHFKWARDARNGRRLHRTPNAGEVRACHPWLQAEIALVQPRVIVCLGATAAKSLLGRTFSVTKRRGTPVRSPWAPAVFATVHPSAILRAPRQARARAERAFVADLQRVARFLDSAATAIRRAKPERRKAHPADKLAAWPTSAAPSDTSSASTRSSPR